MLKKILLAVFFIIALFLPGFVSAADNQVNLYFFWSKACPHCAKEKVFLQTVAPTYPNLKVYDFEVSGFQNTFLLQKIGKELNIETSGVPIVIVGDTDLIGYLSDDTTGQRIVALIEKYTEEGDPDPVGKIIADMVKGSEGEAKPTGTPTIKPTPQPSLQAEESTAGGQIESLPERIKLPIIGNIETKKLSLPLLTVVIALIDGFNPCAMWVLLFLISLLLGMKDKKRMWLLGSAFIMASAFVYFLFLSAWLNLFLFLGFIFWVRILVGVIAVGSGGYFLYDFYKNKSGLCKITGGEKKQKIFEKLSAITQKEKLYLALGGIILLAFAVNLVELVCSAGLPAIYTQVLSMSNLPAWQYYPYLLLYILIFMLDDLFIFFTAMLTLRVAGLQGKYSRFSHLVGGIIVFLIGLLLLFKPEILMFA